MRRLMQRRTMKRAVPAAAVLSLACIPYLHESSPDPALFRLRVACLFPVAVLLFQMTFAWTPLAAGRSYVTLKARLGAMLAPALVTLALSVYAVLFLDRSLAAVWPGYYPDSPRALLTELPWTAGFQTLAFTTAVYAFAVRFLPRPWFGILAVVLARQALLWAQLDGRLPPLTTVHIDVFAGAIAWLLASAYRNHGFWGPVVISTILSLRLLIAGPT